MLCRLQSATFPSVGDGEVGVFLFVEFGVVQRILDAGVYMVGVHMVGVYRVGVHMVGVHVMLRVGKAMRST